MHTPAPGATSRKNTAPCQWYQRVARRKNRKHIVRLLCAAAFRRTYGAPPSKRCRRTGEPKGTWPECPHRERAAAEISSTIQKENHFNAGSITNP